MSRHVSPTSSLRRVGMAIAFAGAVLIAFAGLTVNEGIRVAVPVMAVVVPAALAWRYLRRR